MVEPRQFVIDGEKRHDQTYRTAIIDHLVGISGKSFIDLGCADGYETYTVALHGARSALGIEGRMELVEQARAAAQYLKIDDKAEFQVHDVRRIDEVGLGKFDVVLHFGLLYHMENPFNLLKRVRNICGGDLLMETQIAPRSLAGVNRGEVNHLSDLTTVTLDGEPFEGRALEYVNRRYGKGIGSLDRRLVFWLTVDSIHKALDRAGFDVLLTVHGDAPDFMQPWSELLGHSHQQMKAFFHARVREPEQHIPVAEGTYKGLYSAPYSYAQLSGFRRWRRWILHRAAWSWREWF